MFLSSDICRQRRRWLIGAALFAAALGGSAARADAPSAADKAPASVPGQRIAYVDYTPLMEGKTELGQPLVHVKINGTQDAVFFVDTGFTTSVISPDLADKMGLHREDGVGKDGKPLTWGGKPAKITKVSRFQVGPVTFTDVPVLVLEPSQSSFLSGSTVDGILGLNVLHILAFYIDGPEHRLGFCTPGTLDTAQIKQFGMLQPAALPLTEGLRGWYVSAQASHGVSSGTQEMLVDTGSDTTSVSDVLARQLDLKAIFKVGTSNLDGNSVVSKTSVPLLHLGGLALTDQPVNIEPPLSTLPALLLHDPSPKLGMDVLSSYRVLLDFPGGKVYIQPPPSLLPEAGSAYIAEKRPLGTAADKQANALVNQGVADANAGHVDRAFTKYNQVLTLTPANVAALTHRSLAYSNTGKMDLALADARHAVLLAPNDADAHNCLALALDALGKTSEALLEFRQAITDAGPAAPKAQLAESYFNLGVVCGQQSDTAQAIAAYTQAIALDPTSFKSYINRGNTYDGSGDAVRAIADDTLVITKASATDPFLSIAHNNRGFVYLRNGDADTALTDFDQAIAHNPKFAEAYKGRGEAYLTQNKTAQAITDFTQAVHLAPGDAENYYNRGVARTQSDSEGAIADFTQAIKFDPKYVNAYINRGNLYDGKGDEDKAIADATSALTSLPPGDPHIPAALYNRSLAYAKKGDKEKAAADRAEVFKLDKSLEKLTTAK